MGNQNRWLWIGLIGLILALLGPAFWKAEVIGDGVDLHGTIWFYDWIFECINHLKNPSFTDQFYYPYGKDIFAHTGNNFVDAVLFYPFKLFIDYPYNYLIFIGFLLFLNSVSFYVLLRILLKKQIVIGGALLLSLSSPFVLFELIAGRPTQACLFAAPMAIRELILILRGDTKLRRGLYLGFWVALQGYIYWFYAYFLAAVLFLLCLSYIYRLKASKIMIFKSILLSVVTCFICVGPMVLGMLARIESEVVPGMNVIPTAFDQLPSLQNNVLTTLHGILQLEGDKQPVFTVVPWTIGVLLTLFHPKTRWRWGLILAVILLFSVGPFFIWEGVEIRNWPYLAAYHYLPFYSRLWFPYRWASMATIVIVIGSSIAIEHWMNDRFKPHWIVAFVPFMLAVPQLYAKNMFPLHSVKLDTPDIYLDMAQIGGALIELPIGISKPSLAYQADHGLPTFGGMGENARIFSPPAHVRRMRNGFIQFLRRSVSHPSEAKPFNPFQVQRLTDQGYRFVVLDRALAEAYACLNDEAPMRNQRPFVSQKILSAQLGEPWGIDGRYVVWSLVETPPPSAKLRPENQDLFDYTWPPESQLFEVGGMD